MLNITKKTSRQDLVTEIETQRMQIDVLKEIEQKAHNRAAHAEHVLALRETDVANLLGTIRVMSDSSRLVRIRRSSVRDADMAVALPSHNAEKL